MKNLTLLVILMAFTTIIYGQKVDSIKVEQTGDFIKIGYKILDSKPGQVYRVGVLCSINGGLNTEIKSVSGDTGDNVQGGKPEYFVVWDVLKDVNELTSAEFIIRAELIKDINNTIPSGKNIETTSGWSKRWIHIGASVALPEAKPGFTIGIMGSFGVAFSVHVGQYAVDSEIPLVMCSITIEEFLTDNNVSPTTYMLTKRIVNYNDFQMHMMAGVERTRLVFQDPNALENPYSVKKLYGPAVGLTADYNLASITIRASHIDPGPVEKTGDRGAISPLTYFSLSAGIRF